MGSHLISTLYFLFIITVFTIGFVSAQTTGYVEDDFEEYTDTPDTNTNDTDDLSEFLSELFDDLPISNGLNNDTQETNVDVQTKQDGEYNMPEMTTARTSLSSFLSEWQETDTFESDSSLASYYEDDYDEVEEKTESENCYKEATLQNFCTVSDDMTDLSFWDLYSVLFDDSVMEALIIDCPRGTWCLQFCLILSSDISYEASFQDVSNDMSHARIGQEWNEIFQIVEFALNFHNTPKIHQYDHRDLDRFDYWDAQIVERAEMAMKSEIAADMCTSEMTSCLDTLISSYANCSVYSQLTFSYEAIKLACHLRENPDLSLDCYKQTLVSLHVTVADILREAEEGEELDGDEGQCNAAETSMTKGLICMENACPGESEAFRGFEPWQWFTGDVYELISECELDPNTCVNVLQVGSSTSSISTTSPLTSTSSSSGNTVLTNFWETSELSYGSTSTSTVQPMEKLYNKKPFGEEMLKQEVGMMVGMSIGATVIAVVMLLLSVTCYKRYRRNEVLKDGYQKLLNDGDES